LFDGIYPDHIAASVDSDYADNCEAGAGGVGIGAREDGAGRAREGRKGLWAELAPISPWIYRKASHGETLER